MPVGKKAKIDLSTEIKWHFTENKNPDSGNSCVMPSLHSETDMNIMLEVYVHCSFFRSNNQMKGIALFSDRLGSVKSNVISQL